MKKITMILFLLSLLSIATAQENTVELPQGYVMDTTLGYIIDTTLLQEVVITSTRPVTRLRSNGI